MRGSSERASRSGVRSLHVRDKKLDQGSIRVVVRKVESLSHALLASSVARVSIKVKISPRVVAILLVFRVMCWSVPHRVVESLDESKRRCSDRSLHLVQRRKRVHHGAIVRDHVLGGEAVEHLAVHPAVLHRRHRQWIDRLSMMHELVRGSRASAQREKKHRESNVLGNVCVHASPTPPIV